MNNANTSFNVGLGQESSTALASALEKRGRRDVCACVPASFLGELGRDEITNCGGSPGRALLSNYNSTKLCFVYFGFYRGNDSGKGMHGFILYAGLPAAASLNISNKSASGRNIARPNCLGRCVRNSRNAFKAAAGIV